MVERTRVSPQYCCVYAHLHAWMLAAGGAIFNWGGWFAANDAVGLFRHETLRSGLVKAVRQRVQVEVVKKRRDLMVRLNRLLCTASAFPGKGGRDLIISYDSSRLATRYLPSLIQHENAMKNESCVVEYEGAIILEVWLGFEHEHRLWFSWQGRRGIFIA